jgi:hypothetical protein
MGSAEKETPKKVYNVPVLTVYGKVHDLTQKIAGTRNFDQGSGARIRTSLH